MPSNNARTHRTVPKAKNHHQYIHTHSKVTSKKRKPTQPLEPIYISTSHAMPCHPNRAVPYPTHAMISYFPPFSQEIRKDYTSRRILTTLSGDGFQLVTMKMKRTRKKRMSGCRSWGSHSPHTILYRGRLLDTVSCLCFWFESINIDFMISFHFFRFKDN